MCSLSQEQKDYLDSTIRKIADFPKPGVIFRDITTLLGESLISMIDIKIKILIM